MENLIFKTGNNGQLNVDQAQGIVECFVAGIGNKDSVGDIVISGAFAKSLSHRKPRVVWGHSWNDPIGKVLEMYEVPVGDSRLPSKMRNAGIGGLYAKVQFNLNSEKGREAFATVAFFGEDQEWSIGYKTIDSIYDQSLQANILKEVELYEVSPVLHGANQMTGTISIKADEKGGLPVIPMHGMVGHHMPAMPQDQQMPRIIVVTAQDSDESSEGDPFAQGLSQDLAQPDKIALQNELAERTSSKIEIINATENTVVFRRTTVDGKTSMYRLPYHREGNQYMFGKPEPYAATPTVQQPMQNVQQKPEEPVVVPNGGIAYRNDDQTEMLSIFGGGKSDDPSETKSEILHLIELPEAYMSGAKDFITPVVRHHKLKARPSSRGVIIDGLMTASALDALQNAVKALGATIGQAGGNIGQAIGKIRDLAQTFNPYALDGDGDGFVQDGSAFMRPFIPVKKPGFDLPDVRGRKRSGDALLDKPRSTPKLPKDKGTWTRAQRNEALDAGIMEPETREDVSYLANRRPDNEGLAKYWDMSEADLTKEGNRLVNARRQATGAEKESIDEELLKISHDFQRRASYADTFGQEFVPPAKRQAPAQMIPEADKPRRGADDADMAVDDALRNYINEADADGFASGTRPYSNTEILVEVARRDGWRGDRQISASSQRKATDSVDAWEQLSDDEKGKILTAEDPSIGEYVDALLKARDDRNAKIRKARTDERNAARKVADAKKRAINKFRKGDVSFVDTRPLRNLDIATTETEDGTIVDSEMVDALLGNWSDLSQDQRNELLKGYDLDGDTPELVGQDEDGNWVMSDGVEDVLLEAFDRHGYENPKYRDMDYFNSFDEADLDEMDRGTEGELPFDEDDDSAAAGEDYVELDQDEDRMRGLASRGEDVAWEKLTNEEQFLVEQEYYENIGGPRPGDRDYDSSAAQSYYEQNPDIWDFSANEDRMRGLASRGSEEEQDSLGARAFDKILEKYWRMWGFDVPDDDEEGSDEPFGFASRGNDEEVKQSKLDELVSGVKDRLIAELETADPSTWKPSWRSDTLPTNPTTGKP